MSRLFRKSKWDTPKSSSYNAVAPPIAVHTAAAASADPSVSSLEAASAAAAKINAVLASKGKLQLKKPKENDKSRAVQNDPIIAEIEINDVPLACRNMLTKRTVQDRISRESGAAVSTRGRYMNEEDKRANTTGERSLYLFVQSLVLDKVETAVNKFLDIIKNISKGTAMSPKISYKNVSHVPNVSSTLGKPVGGLGGVLPSVGNAFQEKVFVGLEHAHPSFNIRDKLQGPGGSFLSHIRMETGASVYLRGRGSGMKERASGRESFENLYIFITHNNQENIQAAKKLCENLVQTIHAEYMKFQSQLMGGPPPQLGVHAVGPPPVLPQFQTAPPPLGTMLSPPASQATVVTVAAQNTPLVSTGLPVSSLAIQQVPASTVMSINNAVAYPHLQRLQVPAQQPTMLTTPVGLSGAVPRQVVLLQSSPAVSSAGIQQPLPTAAQQPQLPAGMVVTPRLTTVVPQAVVTPQGVLPPSPGIPVGVPPPTMTLFTQPPEMRLATTPGGRFAGLTASSQAGPSDKSALPPPGVVHLQTPQTPLVQPPPAVSGANQPLQSIQQGALAPPAGQVQQPPPQLTTQQLQLILKGRQEALQQVAQQQAAQLQVAQQQAAQQQAAQIQAAQQQAAQQQAAQQQAAQQQAAQQQAAQQQAAQVAQQVAQQQAVAQQAVVQQQGAQASQQQTVQLQTGQQQPTQQQLAAARLAIAQHLAQQKQLQATQQQAPDQQQQVALQQTIAQQIAASRQQGAAAQPPAAPPHTVLQQAPPGHPVPAPQSSEVQHHQEAPPPSSLYQTPPPGQLPAQSQSLHLQGSPSHPVSSQVPVSQALIAASSSQPTSLSQAPTSQAPASQPVSSQSTIQGGVIGGRLAQGEGSILGPPPSQNIPSSSIALSSLHSAVVDSPAGQLYQQQTSQAHLTPGGLPAASIAHGIATSVQHIVASSGIPPLQVSAGRLQYSSIGGPITTSEEQPLALRQRYEDRKERGPRTGSHLRGDDESSFARRRRFREDFELDGKSPKSLRTSEFERRGPEMYSRRRRFQEDAGDGRGGYGGFLREREDRTSGYSKESDRRLMPPPPSLSAGLTTPKSLLSRSDIARQESRRAGPGDPLPMRSIVPYDAPGTDSDPEDALSPSFIKRSQPLFDDGRGGPSGLTGHVRRLSGSGRMTESLTRFSPATSLGGRPVDSVSRPLDLSSSVTLSRVSLQGQDASHLQSQTLAGQPFWMAHH